LGFGEFDDLIEVEIFNKKRSSLFVVSIDPVAPDIRHHQIVDFAIVRECKEVLEFVDILLCIQTFGQVEVFIILRHAMAVLLILLIRFECQLFSELLIIFLYRGKVHTRLT